MAVYRVLDDKITYREWDDRLRAYRGVSHKKDEVVDLPDEIAARIEQVTHNPKADVRDKGRLRIIPADEYEAWAAQAGVGKPAERWNDEQLQSMPPNDLIAEMNAAPALAERVLTVEQSRAKPRRAILEHARRIVDATRDGVDGPPTASPLLPPAA